MSTAGAPSTGGAAGGNTGTAGAGGSAGAAGASGAPPPATSATTTPGDWMAGFNDEIKGFVQNKGFKGASDVVDSYRNLEKLVGVPQDRMLKLPENMDSPEGRAIWEKLGAPKEAKEYKLEVPKENGDPKMAEHFAGVFHELGVPKGMAEKIVGKWNEFMAGSQAAVAEGQKAAFNQSEAALKKEWGMAYEQNKNQAAEAARVMGITKEQIDAVSGSLGHEATMKLFHKLSTGVSEHSFIGGRPPGTNVLAPDQAKSRIAELKSDRDFGAKLMKRDSEAVRQWEALHKQAYPGDFNF